MTRKQMFLLNKYTNIYFMIIANKLSLCRSKDSGLYENHHIIPKSLGGSNNHDNMILLTPREHYICHKLLTKMTAGKNRAKMIFAFGTFFNFNFIKDKLKTRFFRARDYEYFKSNMSVAMIIRNTGKPIRLTEHTFKNVVTNEIKKSIIMDFQKYSGLSYAEINHLTRGKHKVIKQWTIFDTELNCYRNEIPHKQNNGSLATKICPHCNKEASTGNYSRWHGDNCKTINPNQHAISLSKLKFKGFS